MKPDDDGAGSGTPLHHLDDRPPLRRSTSPQCGGLRTVALIGSHGPRPGGLATFTVELGEAMTREWPALEHLVMVVADRTRHVPYPSSVRYVIAPSDISAYRRAADLLNAQDVDAVSIQYEDGLHGGPAGIYLLALLRELRMPVVTTLHTLSDRPEPIHRNVIDEILRRSERLVVTSARSAQILREVHGIDADKIDHIPGGGHVPAAAVARAYGRCLERARADQAQRHWRAVDTPSLAEHLVGVPPIELAHVSYLTDDTGLRLHDGDGAGHTLDDNARALALMGWLEQLGADDRWIVSVLASRYLAFLVDGFDVELGRFRSRLSAEGQWSAELAAEETHARALWALGTIVGRARDRGRCHLSAELFRSAMPACADFSSPLAIAYALLGLSEYQRSFAGDEAVALLQRTLAAALAGRFLRGATVERPWLEEQVGVESARVPQALLVAGERLGEAPMLATGARALSWLVGSRGADGDGFVPPAAAASDDGAAQRPVDASATVSACLTALRITGEEPWAEEACRAYAWFLGRNSAEEPIYDPATGACHDAVLGKDLEPGQGAEAIVTFLLASAEIRAAVGALADQLPCDLRQLARGTGTHPRQRRTEVLPAMPSTATAPAAPVEPVPPRAEEHAVSPAHTSADRES